MRILALETSTQLGGAAIIENGRILAERSSTEQRSHSEHLHPLIDDCLNEARLHLSDIDVFAVGQGPGSFTGIRVAANIGKSYAYAFSKPLVSIDSLSLLAAPCLGRPMNVLSIINAHKNMVYLGLFDVSEKEPKYLLGPTAVPVRELKNYINKDCLVVGDGWNAFEAYFPDELKKLMHRDSSLADSPRASVLGLLAEARTKNGQTLDWKSFIPLYIRASEAEETKKGILISPLK
jgi:tRNA threonylcarbamoyladenosine biosynthesis protein TsaB